MSSSHNQDTNSKRQNKKNSWQQQISTRINNAQKRFLHRDEMVKNANTPFDLLYDDGLAKLKHYPALEGFPTTKKTPLLIIPPLAVNTKIFDLMTHRSFIRFMLEHGFSVYMADWGIPSRRHSDYGFTHYVTKIMPNIMKAVRDYQFKLFGEESGRKPSEFLDISTYSWSMGGLFNTLYAAHSKDSHIKNMIMVGVPIDGHAGDTLGSKLLQVADSGFRFLERNTSFHPRNLPDQLLHTPGWINVLSFKALDPVGTAKSYWHLLRNLDDEQALIENATKTDFLNNMLDYPGGIVRDMIIRFWFSNELINGKLKLEESVVDLKNITANIFAIGGKSDSLVTAEHARAIIDVTSSTDATFETIPGGHVGIVASQITSRDTWPKIANWLAERSEAL